MPAAEWVAMELAAAATAVLLAAVVVLRDVARQDRPAPTPRPSRAAPARATAAPQAAPAVLDEPATSVLGAFGGTELDRRPRAVRRATAALLLALVTASIAVAVGGSIYLGLSRLG